MIKRLVTLTLVLVLGGALTAQAAPTLTLIPGNGALVGYPGTNVGWGFSLYNESSYDLYVNGVSADGSLAGGSLGTFSDAVIIWSLGSLTIAAGDTYNGTVASGTPLASFAIKPGAPFGAVPVFGKIYVDYEFNDSSFEWQGSGTLSADASVTTIPEPSTYILLGLSLGVVAYARKKMQQV